MRSKKFRCALFVLLFFTYFGIQTCIAQDIKNIVTEETDTVLLCSLENPKTYSQYKQIELDINYIISDDNNIYEEIYYQHGFQDEIYDKPAFHTDFQLKFNIKDSTKVYSGVENKGKLYYISLINSGYEYLFYKTKGTILSENKYGVVIINGGHIVSINHCFESKGNIVNDEHFFNAVTSATRKHILQSIVDYILHNS